MGSTPSPLRAGDLVGGCWRIGDRIGQGTYSEIFECFYTPPPGFSTGSKSGSGDADAVPIRAAAKIDHPSPRVGSLEWESNLLLRLQKYAFVPRHYGLYTADDGRTKVLVMQLLGNNISTLRRRQPDSCTMPFGAAVHIMLQMLAATECIHVEGYIHRDLKPSNFVHGNGRAGRGQIYVLDFGQSRMYVDDAGGIRPPRDKAGFRGTSLYSSLNAHNLLDLGRRDDLWSLFYGFIDMVRGGLPWRVHKDDRKKCGLAKQYYYDHPDDLVHGLPGEAHLLALQAHLKGVSFEGKPDYRFFAESLQRAYDSAARAELLYCRSYPRYPPHDELLALWAGVGEGRGQERREEGEIPPGPPTKSSLLPLPSPHPAAPAGSAGVLGGTSGNVSAGTAEAGLGAGMPPAMLSVDIGAEDLEFLAAFDATKAHYSCDSVLESRGGQWGEWEVDKDSQPVYLSLFVGPNGRVTEAGSKVFRNIVDEMAACKAVLSTHPAEEEAAPEEEDAPDESNANAGSLPVAHVSGHKRRRPDEINYDGLSETQVVKDINDRLNALYAAVNAGTAAGTSLDEVVWSWTKLANAAVIAFSATWAADTVKQETTKCMLRLLGVSAAREANEPLSDVASEIRASHRFFVVPSLHSVDMWNAQLAMGKVEAWVAANSVKPPPLIALQSLQSAIQDSSSDGAEAKLEKAIRAEARRRVATLEKLFVALTRERELLRPQTADLARIAALASMAPRSITRPLPNSHTVHPAPVLKGVWKVHPAVVGPGPLVSSAPSAALPMLRSASFSDAKSLSALGERDMEIE